jgi:RNA helicase./Putative viral replication protein.
MQKCELNLKEEVDKVDQNSSVRNTQVRARNWLLTLNNPGMKTLEMIHIDTKAVYTCGQMEKGKDGTTHLQFFQNFKQATNLGFYKKYDKRIHAEPVIINNGAHDYVMKEDTRIEGPWSYGIKPVQRNNKTDWDEVFKNAKEGKFDDISADIKVKHYGNLKKIERDHLLVTDHDDLRGVWIYGPAGYGKSRQARELYPNHYPKLCNKWWDGYQGQENVIMDDIGLDHKCLGQQLKIWSDRYGCILENKGGAMTSSYKHFVVTSQYSIDQIWDDEETRAALKRRFKVTQLVFPMYPLNN